eukprot:TRINITY_DN10446_c0_g1_i5.p1 TRINITY_DN10446_c0_g1~~TRINITY_DN10446_c0_g1_i5.p1  ORF type:complete len:145 (-),score=18.84 TRINITY_DN10446_c0_g1_i5:391-825(-)
MQKEIYDSILGVLVGYVEENNGIECVCLIGVSPTAMRKGIGRKLMEAVDARATTLGKTSIRLTVNQHSVQSYPFYLSLGFQGSVKKYKHHPTNSGMHLMVDRVFKSQEQNVQVLPISKFGPSSDRMLVRSAARVLAAAFADVSR